MGTAAWTQEKVDAFREAFFNFLNYLTINSKEDGQIVLGEHVYTAQRRFLEAIFAGLLLDIHDFKVLKSRQLGISTFSRALTLFWIGMHDGLKGYMLFDTAAHCEEARIELVGMIEGLPASLGFPKIKRKNRYLLELDNGSMINFASAGVRQTKASGVLGRSSGINFVHACLHPDTPVITGDGVVKRIRDVQVGDRVVTHSGAMAKVIANEGLENDRGPMRRITPWLGEGVLCTDDHKIVTQRGLIEARDVGDDDMLVMPTRKITADRVRDSLPMTPHRVQNGGAVAAASGLPIEFTEELGFGVGYYLAEGCMTFQRRGERYQENPAGILFARHRNETSYADRAIAALEPYTTGHRGTVDKTNCLTTIDRVYGSSLARWIADWFGYADNKHIPDDVFSWGEDFCRGLVAGMLCGDGSKTVSIADGYAINRVQLTSTRSSLALQLRDLVAALGIGWAAAKYRKAGQYYGRNCKESWMLTWCGTAAASLRRLIGLPVVPGGRARAEKYKISDGHVYLRIRKIETDIAQPFMHDLSVDHPDHTFRTPWMSVSNSEMCSWDNVEGLESFKNALAEDFPNRLYIWESTARGFNQWHEQWEEAVADKHHQSTTFIGWWAKDNQRISVNDPDFERYGLQPPTDTEIKKILAVKEQYGHEITPEQLAWIRRKMSPNAEAEGDAPAEYEGDVLKIQEQPWTEQEAFQMTGATFFDPEKLTEQATQNVSKKFKTYTYGTGIEFVDSTIYPAPNAKSVQLKVWEEPENDAVYIIAADPAYGANEHNDRSACQVLRAYADGLDQVAEYAWPLVNTRQFAWVIASLLGHYSTVGGAGKADVYFILEINGPGDGVLKEIQSLKNQIQHSYTPKQVEEKGLRNIFHNVKQYVYSRSDSMGPGHAWHWKTTGPLKVSIMERLRDFTSNGMLRVRSQDTLEEMRSITREGDSIEAQGSKKDDRVLSLAMAIRCWEDRCRRNLVATRRTRKFEEAKKRLTVGDQINLFNKSMMESFFSNKMAIRKKQANMLRREGWRSRR